jgi:hypothetical protein
MNDKRKTAQLENRSTRLLLACRVIAGPLFTISWLLEGTTRVGYDALRHPISSLSIGDFGWTQVTNFLITGVLLLAFAFGLRHALRALKESTGVPLLIALIGFGLIGAGIFVTDPMNGYPLDTPNLPLQYSLAGRLHRFFSAFVFLGLPVACFMFARLFTRYGEGAWAVYSRATGIAFLLAFIVTTAGFAQVNGLANFAGLLQRITLTIGFAWLMLLALYWLRVHYDTVGRTANS